jgi:hypothetical protein
VSSDNFDEVAELSLLPKGVLPALWLASFFKVRSRLHGALVEDVLPEDQGYPERDDVLPIKRARVIIRPRGWDSRMSPWLLLSIRSVLDTQRFAKCSRIGPGCGIHAPSG